MGSLGGSAALLPAPGPTTRSGNSWAGRTTLIYKSWASVCQQGFLAESVEAWRLLLGSGGSGCGRSAAKAHATSLPDEQPLRYMFGETAYQRETWPLRH